MTFSFSQTPQQGQLSARFSDGTDYGVLNVGGGATLSVALATNILLLDCIIHAHSTTNGTVDLQWAQSSSNAAATTVYKGSFLELLQQTF